MKNICFITTTRAEYGLLKPLIDSTKNTSEFCITLIVSGTHLLSSFGNTFEEIKKDFTDFYKIPIMEENTLDMCKIISKVFDTFPEEIKKINDIKKIDLAVILGDRFEILAISQVLFILGIILANLSTCF